MMRISKWMLLFLAVCLVTSVGVQADDSSIKPTKSLDAAAKTGPKSKLETTKSMVAEISVPKLNEEKVKKFAMVLKKHKGIQAVKPDMEASNILVTYDKKLDFKKLVMPELMKVDADAKLIGVVKAKAAPAGKCGGCPHKAKCAGDTKKTESTKVDVKETGGCAGK